MCVAIKDVRLACEKHPHARQRRPERRAMVNGRVPGAGTDRVRACSTRLPLCLLPPVDPCVWATVVWGAASAGSAGSAAKRRGSRCARGRVRTGPSVVCCCPSNAVSDTLGRVRTMPTVVGIPSWRRQIDVTQDGSKAAGDVNPPTKCDVDVASWRQSADTESGVGVNLPRGDVNPLTQKWRLASICPGVTSICRHRKWRWRRFAPG